VFAGCDAFLHGACRSHKLQRTHAAGIAVISFESVTEFQQDKRTYDVTCGENSRPTRKIKAAPNFGEPLRYRRCKLFYWVGNSSCENPIVFTERNEGVRGGSHCGPSVKLLSNVYLREGAWYTVLQHLYNPTFCRLK
jgi:hypothetical protein